jgi:hypothetical protein
MFHSIALRGLMAAFLLVGSLPAALLVVPGANQNTEGDSNNGFPLNIGGFGVSSMRYQQVYDAGEFPTSIIEITAIRFRPNDFAASAYAGVLSDIRVDLSTTSAAVNGLNTTFASNVGADNVTVFSGAWASSSANTGGPPRDFDIVLTLTTSFFYNPSLGNLLLDVYNFNGGLTTQFDAVLNSGVTSRMWAGNVNAATGGGDPSALVTQFEYEEAGAVPEPATFAMLGAGLLAAVVARRKR